MIHFPCGLVTCSLEFFSLMFLDNFSFMFLDSYYHKINKNTYFLCKSQNGTWCLGHAAGWERQGNKCLVQYVQRREESKAKGVCDRTGIKGEKHLHLWWVTRQSLRHAQGAPELWNLDPIQSWTLEWQGFHHHRRCAPLSSWWRDTRQVPVTPPWDCHANPRVYMEIRTISESRSVWTV